MRKFRLALLSLALTGATFAGQVRVAWGPSPDDHGTNGVTYKVYLHTNSLTEPTLRTAAVQVSAETNRTVSLLSTNAGRWFVRATAVLDNVESEPSNELIVDFPSPPTELRSVALEYTFELNPTNTVWQRVHTDLFLRLKP